MGRGQNLSSELLYGEGRHQARRLWLVPAPDPAGDYPPLHDVPITDCLLADLSKIPQTLTDDEKSRLIAGLERRRENGWGVYCGFMAPVDKHEIVKESPADSSPRVLLPFTAVIRVMVTIPERIDLEDPTNAGPELKYPAKFRISSMGLPTFDPWNQDQFPDLD